jgi:hypothetical protein
MRSLNILAIATLALMIAFHGTNSSGQAPGLSPQFATGTNQLAVNYASPPPPGGQGSVPRGDYQQTCRDITTNGSTIQARCQKRDGDWRTTSLNYRDCHGGIINDDGHLRCGSGYQGGGYHGGGWQGGLPRGDYQLTCRDARVNGNQLNATCQKRDGSWRNTSLNNYNQCRSKIVNDDGHLQCQR